MNKINYLYTIFPNSAPDQSWGSNLFSHYSSSTKWHTSKNIKLSHTTNHILIILVQPCPQCQSDSESGRHSLVDDRNGHCFDNLMERLTDAPHFSDQSIWIIITIMQTWTNSQTMQTWFADISAENVAICVKSPISPLFS